MPSETGKTQKDLILNYLKSHSGITQLEACEPPMNCLRLSERIRELQADGHPIRKERRKVPSGKTVMEYFLVKSDSTGQLALI